MKFKEFLRVLKKCKPLSKDTWTFESVLWNLYTMYDFNIFD